MVAVTMDDTSSHRNVLVGHDSMDHANFDDAYLDHRDHDAHDRDHHVHAAVVDAIYLSRDIDCLKIVNEARYDYYYYCYCCY